jgi:nucleotide-binding universal stress UspA family protein
MAQFDIDVRGCVVVGYDGSVDPTDAVRWAAHEAVLRGLPLTLVHCAREPNAVSGHLIRLDGSDLQWGLPRLEIRTLVRSEPVSEVLVALSEQARVLVVGGRRRVGFAGRLLDSDLRRLAARTRCPVIVVCDGTEPPGHGEVLLGIGAGEPRAPIRFAFEAAARYGGVLKAISLAHRIPHGRGERPDAGASGALDLLAALRGEFAQVAIEALPRDTDPATALADESRQARLVVIGSTDSIVERLLTHSCAPVALVPTG